MKIQFISNYGQLYGGNRVLLTLLKYLHSKGDDISVLLPSKGDMSDALKKAGISYKIIFYHSSFLYARKKVKFLAYPVLLLLDLIALPKIYFHIKKNNPDIIYSNTSAENFGIIISRLLNKKHISHIHEFMDLDHQAYFIGGNRLKKKYINKSDGIVFVSESVANHVLQGESLSQKQMIVYNGLPESKNNQTLKERKNSKIQNYGIVGILSQGKRQDMAIQYFKHITEKHPDSMLHVFGDKKGRYKEYLFRLVNDLKLESNILFHGFINDTEQIYAELDILLMFSEFEGFGLVTVEAMLRGIPVIGYDNAGTSELIERNISGCLFKEEKTFMDSVAYLQHDDTYNIVRNNAFQRAKSMFNEQKYCLDIATFIKKTYNYEN